MKITQTVEVEITINDDDHAECSAACNFLSLDPMHESGAWCWLFNMNLFNVKNAKDRYILGRCAQCNGRPADVIPIKRKRGRPRKNSGGTE